MSVTFNHGSTASRLPKDKHENDITTHVEDFVQPKDLFRSRRTGYSPGHIRSVLNLDTFGPNHSELVEALRSSGELPPSPNGNRFATGRSPSAAYTVKFDFGDSSAASLSGLSLDGGRKSVAPRSRRPSDSSMASVGSGGSLGSTNRMPTPSTKAQIIDYDVELHRSTPTAKRLEYAVARQIAQKERREMKLQEKKRKKNAQIKEREILDTKSEIERFEQALRLVAEKS